MKYLKKSVQDINAHSLTFNILKVPVLNHLKLITSKLNIIMSLFFKVIIHLFASPSTDCYLQLYYLWN